MANVEKLISGRNFDSYVVRRKNTLTPDMWHKKKIEKFRNDVDYVTEATILGFTEMVVEKMQKTGLSRAELAQKLGVSKPFVTKLLNGNPNMTIKTMVSIAHALECEMKMVLRRKGAGF